jgi:predicted Zn-dependent protease
MMATVMATAILLATVGLGCAGSGAKGRGPDSSGRTVLLTMADDARTGAEAAESVEVEVGLLEDPELMAYVEGIGQKLLHGLPRREFAYRFSIVDQMEPNAFALPGGHIYVSRGLLALINDVDELACVLGHEIVHAARRHAAQQQAVARYKGRFSLPTSRAATMAAYSRDMEREADRLGQQLCAAAGYDPMALSTFLRSLDQRERLLVGAPRVPTFFDTHPGSRERAAANSVRASEMRWTRDPRLGDVRTRHLDQIDGMVLGDRPETGLFLDELFVHPVLGFQMRFPKGWQTQNSSRAVGARAPRGDAVVYLTGDLPAGDLVAAADDFAKKAQEEEGVRLTGKQRVVIGTIDGVRYAFESSRGFPISALITFFPYREGIWRMVGMAPAAAADRYFGPILLSMRSFAPLSDANRARIRIDRLEVVLARAGEDVVALGERTDNRLDPASTALLNGMLGNETLSGGELMKIVRRISGEAALAPGGSSPPGASPPPPGP